VTPFDDIQEHVETLLKATPRFADVPAAEEDHREKVLLDDGHTQNLQANALRDYGFYALILPLLDGDLVQQGGPRATVDVGIAVRVAVNPTKEGVPHVTTLMTEVKETLLAWAPPALAKERYRIAEKAFVLTQDDAGEFAYNLFFVKQAVF